jgi:hypothetical protein
MVAALFLLPRIVLALVLVRDSDRPPSGPVYGGWLTSALLAHLPDFLAGPLARPLECDERLTRRRSGVGA